MSVEKNCPKWGDLSYSFFVILLHFLFYFGKPNMLSWQSKSKTWLPKVQPEGEKKNGVKKKIGLQYNTI